MLAPLEVWYFYKEEIALNFKTKGLALTSGIKINFKHAVRI
jgi:hypothetical protein